MFGRTVTSGIVSHLAAGVLGFLLLSAPASGQPEEQGKLFLDIFAPRDYDGHVQNWQLAQDDQGILYVANYEGVIEYDGERWRHDTTLARLYPRSIAAASDGTVYVGARGDLGYLDTDERGAHRFVSLLGKIPESARDLGPVFQVVPTPQGVYFREGVRLFRWRPDEPRMEMWTIEEPAAGGPAGSRTLGFVDGRLIVPHSRAGLRELVGDAFETLPGSQPLAGKRVTAFVPLTDETLLVCTRQSGLFVYDGSAVRPWETEAGRHGRENEALDCRRLRDGRFALATFYDGVALFDRTGRLLRLVNRDAGLPDNTANSVFEDALGGLWVASNRGLVRVELEPLQYFDEDLGFDGVARAVVRHRGKLYAATSQGVFRLEPSATVRESARFVRVAGAPVEVCRDLLSWQGRLLTATDQGLFEIDGERFAPEPLLSGSVRDLEASRDGQRIYVGTEGDGLHVLELHDGRFVDRGRLEPTSETLFAMVEDAAGRLWLRGLNAQMVQRIERLDLASGEDGVHASPLPIVPLRGNLRIYGPEDGLPAGERIYPFLWREQIYVGTSSGLYRYLPDDDRFGPDPELGQLVAAMGGRVATARPDFHGRLWFNLGFERTARADVDEAGRLRFAFPLERVGTRFFFDFYFESGGTLVWAATEDGRLVRYEEAVPPDARFPARIRRVNVAHAGGETLWDGGAVPGGGAMPVLPFSQNALRFEYALPHFCGRASNVYQTRLVGLSEAWSDWSRDIHRDFTELGEGSYRFEVRGRDVFGTVSDEAAYEFRVLPPWYQTRWAWAFYALSFLAVAGLLGHVTRKKLERERAINRRLREIDRLKDEFLATTSHELRTPLYGMIGLTESLLDGAAGELSETTRSTLAMIVGSGRRLGQLVDDILDFSNLRRQTPELERKAVDLRALVEVVVTLSRHRTVGKDLELDNTVPSDLPPADADENRLLQVLHALVDNAVKFTAEGRITVSAKAVSARDRGERLEVCVADTGIGIAEIELERIFEVFEQADGSAERPFGGTGLGLAITRKLVELHGGEMWAESTPGSGSRFYFTLPASSAPRAEPSALAHTVARLRRGMSDAPSKLPAPGPAAAADDGGGARVLVVDDEPIIRLILSRQLAKEHYRVTEATNGPEALRLLDEEDFDLVLLDIMMPEMSGYEVCRRLRERSAREELPVLFLTAKNQVTDLVDGFEAGGNDYLTKPVSKEELLARVRAHLDLLRTHRELESLVAARTAELLAREELIAKLEASRPRAD